MEIAKIAKAQSPGSSICSSFFCCPHKRRYRDACRPARPRHWIASVAMIASIKQPSSLPSLFLPSGIHEGFMLFSVLAMSLAPSPSFGSANRLHLD